MSVSKRKAWIAIVFWIFLFIMHFHMGNFFQPWKYAIISATYNTITFAVMYYLTVLYLFPTYYDKGKKYFIVSSLIIIILGTVFTLINMDVLPEIKNISHTKPPIQFHFARYIMSMAFTFFVGTSISLMERTTKMRETEKVLMEEKLETEMKLLKAQINPHFIFNALNNIYSLSYMQSQKAPESVLKLSEMLRYVFYDCSKDRVPLSAELNYIENFNAFQQMKSEYEQNIELKMEKELGHIEIAPMLFIPFLENAYKYSRIEENEDAYVKILISSDNGKVQLSIKNSISQNVKSSHGSGIGIKNVKHRLDIIYPGKHELIINEQSEFFSVDLIIET